MLLSEKSSVVFKQLSDDPPRRLNGGIHVRLHRC
jgi:hypothetical protein